MTKQMNEPIDLTNGHDSTTPLLNGAAPKARPLDRDKQLGAFRDLARRICTDRSVQRFETALHKLLLPVKKAKREEVRALPPTHNPGS
jgi:hypothetical protein